MTEQEKIGKGLQDQLSWLDTKFINSRAVVSQVLAYLHSERCRIEVDKELPEPNKKEQDVLWGILSSYAKDNELTWLFDNAIEFVQATQQDMLKAGYVATEPLIKDLGLEQVPETNDTCRHIDLWEAIYHTIVGYTGKGHELTAYAYATQVLKDVDLIKEQATEPLVEE